MRRWVGYVGIGLLMVTGALATNYYVSPSGDDDNPGTIDQPWATIQKAADEAGPGDTVFVRDGVYYEQVQINVSGAPGQYIVFTAYPGETPILDGTGGTPGEHMIYINSQDYIKIEGFTIRNDTLASGIFVEDAGDYIEIRNNEIYNMKGPDGMGITVYAHVNDSVTHITIEGNHIHDCYPAESEALVVNGNVFDFVIQNNLIHDVDNIGIDAIGGEVAGKVAKRGVIRGNEVYNARASYGGGYAAGIYIDGAQQVVVEQNRVHHCDMGIEVGCENAGYVAEACTVRANLIYYNDKPGLIFGGYDASAGRVQNCVFENNTLFKNQVLADGDGEVVIQYASDNLVRNNIVYAGPQGILLTSWGGNVNNTLDYNCWKPSSEPHASLFVWNNTEYTTFAAYQSGTGQDAHSLDTNPLLRDTLALDFRLDTLPLSPCVDAGDPATPAALDFDGITRPRDGDGDNVAVVDIGAYELPQAPVAVAEGAGPEAALFRVVPQITKGEVQVMYQLSDHGVGLLTLYDATGRRVGRWSVAGAPSTQKRRLHLSGYPSGVYWLRLEGPKNPVSRRIVVIR